MSGSLEAGSAGQKARPGCMIRLGRRFTRDQTASTTIEFGFVIVPFFALLFSVFENGFLLMVDDGITQANTTAARQVLIGTVQNDTTITTAAQYLDKMICNPVAPMSRVLPSYIDCSKVVVDVRALPAGSNSFNATAQALDFYTVANTNKFCPGDPGGIVMVRLMYPMPAYFPVLTTAWIANNGSSSAGLQTYRGSLVHITLSTSVFQSEAFINSGGIKPGC